LGVGLAQFLTNALTIVFVPDAVERDLRSGVTGFTDMNEHRPAVSDGAVLMVARARRRPVRLTALDGELAARES